MRYTKTSCGLAAALLLTCAASSANALALRTWVSGIGFDDNPCSRTAPCKTFAGALAKTEAGGEISVLDPAGYGQITITKSITINGTPGAGYGSMLATKGSSGIVINMAKDDPYKTVRLNWLDINGVSDGLHGIRIVDGQAAGVSVVIENTNIDGFAGSGISDERSVGGKLTVSNTAVRHTQQSGIRIAAGGLGNKIRATLSNVRVHNSAQAGLTVNGGARAMVVNSVLSGSAIGVDVEQANSEAFVHGIRISENATGLFTNGGGVLRLSNSDVSFNDSAANGAVESFSSNRFTGNGAAGPVTPIGAPTIATGLR